MNKYTQIIDNETISIAFDKIIPYDYMTNNLSNNMSQIIENKIINDINNIYNQMEDKNNNITTIIIDFTQFFLLSHKQPFPKLLRLINNIPITCESIIFRDVTNTEECNPFCITYICNKLNEYITMGLKYPFGCKVYLNSLCSKMFDLNGRLFIKKYGDNNIIELLQDESVYQKLCDEFNLFNKWKLYQEIAYRNQLNDRTLYDEVCDYIRSIPIEELLKDSKFINYLEQVKEHYELLQSNRINIIRDC